MGSRYGGLKQLDGLGPNGETIMDYSVFDALRAGFGKIKKNIYMACTRRNAVLHNVQQM